MVVRASGTVALKNPLMMDNTTSGYRKQPSGPNLVTPAAWWSSVALFYY